MLKLAVFVGYIKTDEGILGKFIHFFNRHPFTIYDELVQAKRCRQL